MNSKDWDEVSKDYYSNIISPIKNSIGKNPLFEDLNQLDSDNRNVIDLGCGLGPLAPILSENFKKVTGIDFSKKMIEKAKKNNERLTNTTFIVADMKNLTEFYNKYDVAIAINSLVAKDINTINKIINEIFKVLKEGGELYAVLPSMETYIYQGMLVIDKELRKGNPQYKARKKALKLLSPDEHDFVEGKITYGGDTQKALYRFEILHRFSKAGFVDIKIGRIHYDWIAWRDSGQSYFPTEEPPWDWYLSCQKPKSPSKKRKIYKSPKK